MHAQRTATLPVTIQLFTNAQYTYMPRHCYRCVHQKIKTQPSTMDLFGSVTDTDACPRKQKYIHPTSNCTAVLQILMRAPGNRNTSIQHPAVLQIQTYAKRNRNAASVSQSDSSACYRHSYNGPYRHDYNSPYKGPYRHGYNGPYRHGYNSPYKGPYRHGYNSPYGDGYNSPYRHGYNGPYRHGYNSPYKGPYRDGYNSPYRHGNNGPYRHGYNGPYRHGYNSPCSPRHLPAALRTQSSISP